MRDSSVLKVFIGFISLVLFAFIFSEVSTRLWGSRPEEIPARQEFVFRTDMTIAEFGRENKIPNPVLAKAFSLQSKQDLENQISKYGFTEVQVKEKVSKVLAVYLEQKSKNWTKIVLKFILWFVFLLVVFILMRNSLIDAKSRKWIYLMAVAIFGIALGSDPSPMGTVKDAIVLYGANKVIFLPRLIALSIFLILVVVANKFICSWGCQLGTLQDLIFRLNRNLKDNKGIIRQRKPKFVVTNTIRFIFFLAFTVIAFLWASDLIQFVDPFKFYNPSVLTLLGWIFVAAILISSLFIYRPWCHLFCPFGLIGWLAEKISIFKIKVNYETCIACQACAKACPSNVMDAILRRKNTVPDCFSCSTCINVCPTNSIKFGAGKRDVPPKDKFG